ncbi:MAG: response regulator [Armatimonadetes bacterium]|nr:response regulator [Armatimonadota bacterium]
MESILLVEDEDIIAQNMVIKLKKLGCKNTYTAKSGEQALRIIEEKHPDLIIVDIVLEGKMSGIELAQKVKNHNGIPVIFVTADSNEETINKAKLTSSFGYIIKPFRDKDLKIAIDTALSKFIIE